MLTGKESRRTRENNADRRTKSRYVEAGMLTGIWNLFIHKTEMLTNAWRLVTYKI